MGRITRDRSLTDEEKRHYAEVRRQVADELSDIKRLAQVVKPKILLKQVLQALKQERERQGLSLTDLNQKSGIDPESLRSMENDLDPNVSMSTLLRYAEAMGKALTVHIEDGATTPGT